MLSNPGGKLRDLINEENIIVAPGAYDGISARLIKEAGYKVIYRTGGGAAASVLGQPDIGLMTLTEMVTHAANMVEAVDLPIIADADTGYGNVLNTIRTVHEFERAGVAAIHLEDQIFPKRCGHLAGKQVIAKDEFAQKIKAASAERYCKDFVIIARTDARAVEGFEKAIERCKNYVEAGADVIFFEAPQSIEEIEKIPKELKGIPVLINMATGGKTPSVNIKDLEQMGYKIVIFPAICMSPALLTMREALKYLAEHGTDIGYVDPMIVSPLELFKVVGIEEWQKLEKKYSN